MKIEIFAIYDKSNINTCPTSFINLNIKSNLIKYHTNFAYQYVSIDHIPFKKVDNTAMITRKTLGWTIIFIINGGCTLIFYNQVSIFTSTINGILIM